jgi:hypothetical protein
MLFIPRGDHRSMPETAPAPERCTLAHPLFGALGEIWFRHAETDRTPVLAMHLGEREAAVPLRALQNEFGIASDSPDGRMLKLIANALDFVSLLRPGDKLPAEVLTGDASWQPEAMHFQLAAARVKLQLTSWLGQGGGPEQGDADPQMLLSQVDDPAMRQRLQEAMAQAARAMGLDSSEQVVSLIEELAGELAYVEALRDRLLTPVTELRTRLAAIGRRRLDPAHMETITQVQRLCGIGLRDIAARFEELDAQTGEVMAALQNVSRQREFIRKHRDWLFRSQRAWEPILNEWASFDESETPELLWALVARTYQFLAPRFMPVTEWQSTFRPTKEPQKRAMTW